MARSWSDELLMDGVPDTVTQVSSPQVPEQKSWSDDVLGMTQVADKPAPIQPVQSHGIWDRIKGIQDSAYKDVPAFNTTQASVGDGMQTPLFMGMLGGANDKAYGDIIQKNLGPKFVRRFKDANGYELIEHTNTPDGKPTTAYVSKPGLDLDGVVRGAVGAIPYVVTGGGMTSLMKGAPLAYRAAAQMGASGATSVAGDVMSSAAGSQQGIDIPKAGLATLGGGLGEAVPSRVLLPLMAGGAAAGIAAQNPDASKGDVAATGLGTAAAAFGVSMLARRLLGMNPGTYADAAGKLTAKGEDIVKQAGMNPAEVQGEMGKVFAQTYAKTRDPVEAALRAQAGPIPQTLGQRTKDYQQMVREDRMRAGIDGDDAQRLIKNFDDQQKQAIEAAAFNGPTKLNGAPVPPPPVQRAQGVAPPPPIPPQQPGTGIGGTIAPHRFNTQGVTAETLGDEIRGGLQSNYSAAKQTARDAWKGADDLAPSQAALDMLPDQIKQGIKANGISINDNTPVAKNMIDTLRNYRAGKSPTPADEFLPDMSGQNVNEIRKQLRGMMSSAKDAPDRSAAGAVYKSYNDWIDAAANAGHFAPEVVAAIKAGREATAEMKGLWQPTFKGRQTPAATKISKALESADNPEAVVNALVGDVSTRATAQGGTLQALSNIKQSLSTYGDKELGKETWDNIRLAYWNKVMLTKDGKINSPQMIIKNMQMAEQNQGSVLSVLYTPQERVMMKRFVQALEGPAYRPSNFRTNSSGSAFAGGVMIRDLGKAIWDSLGLSSKLVQAVLGPVTNVAIKPVTNNWNKTAAGQAISQTVKEIAPSLGPYGGAIGAAGSNAFEERRP